MMRIAGAMKLPEPWQLRAIRDDLPATVEHYEDKCEALTAWAEMIEQLQQQMRPSGFETVEQCQNPDCENPECDNYQGRRNGRRSEISGPVI